MQKKRSVETIVKAKYKATGKTAGSDKNGYRKQYIKILVDLCARLKRCVAKGM